MTDAQDRAKGKRNLHKILAVFWTIVAIFAGFNFSTLLMAGAGISGLLLSGAITLVAIVFMFSSVLGARKPRIHTETEVTS